MTKKNQWEWESLKIEIKDPNGKIHTYETLITEYEKSNLFDPLEGWFVDGETKTFEDLINILSSKEDYCDIAYNNDNMTITRIK